MPIRRELGSRAQTVVAAVVDDADLMRLLADLESALREPPSCPGSAPHRVDDEPGAHLAAARLDADNGLVSHLEPLDPTRDDLDARLTQYRPTQRPLDQRPTDAQQDQLGVLGPSAGLVSGDRQLERPGLEHRVVDIA